MKNLPILIFTIMNVSLFGQNSMNENLQKLFLELDLNLAPKDMIAKSKLRFEGGSNRTISWGKSVNDSMNYVASFDSNPLLNSKIEKGIITITSTNSDKKENILSVNERVWFNNVDDMRKEFRKLCSLFETSAIKVQNTIVQNNDLETISENTDIIIDNKQKLIIAYHLSPSNDKEKEYSISFIYSK